MILMLYRTTLSFLGGSRIHRNKPSIFRICGYMTVPDSLGSTFSRLRSLILVHLSHSYLMNPVQCFMAVILV